jgi:ion channel POLLUX/CASTOR
MSSTEPATPEPDAATPHPDAPPSQPVGRGPQPTAPAPQPVGRAPQGNAVASHPGAPADARGTVTGASTEKPSWRLRASYAFDNAMARGPGAVAGVLGIAIAVLIVIFTVILLIVGVGPANPIAAVYHVFLHTIDGGGSQDSDTGTLYTTLSLVVTLTGILVYGTFIGILVTGMDSRLQQLRKGRSVVLERDHTLILGWSERVYTIISELAIANESRRRPSVVILAERDKADMEDAIRENVPNRRNTRVVCRTGSALVTGDLELVNHREARAVILLGGDGGSDPDADVIKSILALTRDGDGDGDVAGRHIVAEVQDANAAHAARLAGGDAVVLINKPQTISRLIVQTSRQSGAAAVYRDILDFAGDEFYMRADERLSGLTYVEAMLAYERCTVVGLVHAGGVIELNPPPGTLVAATDSVIALAEDDSLLDAADLAPTVADTAAIALRPLEPDRPEATLILGYNHRTPLVIGELAGYAVAGSRIDLVSDVEVDDAAIERSRLDAEGIAFSRRTARTTERDVLDGLGIPGYNRVIVMGYTDDIDGRRASARSLLTLLHLRDIAARAGARVAIVSEVIDMQDTELVAVAGVDDIVVSDEVLSLLLTQVAENRHLADVFDKLLQADGPEVYMRPADRYVKAGPVSFATLIAAASGRSETAIGYRTASGGGHAINLNPAKSAVFPIDPGDRLIVLSED